MQIVFYEGNYIPSKCTDWGVYWRGQDTVGGIDSDDQHNGNARHPGETVGYWCVAEMWCNQGVGNLYMNSEIPNTGNMNTGLLVH